MCHFVAEVHDIDGHGLLGGDAVRFEAYFSTGFNFMGVKDTDKKRGSLCLAPRLFGTLLCFGS